MKKVSQQQRFFIALAYIVVITVIFLSFGGTLSEIVDDTSNMGVWFCSAALLIIFGIYLTEPFFSKPVDTITNCTSVLLTLLALPQKKALIGYWFIMTVTLVLLVLSFITIFFKDKENGFLRLVHFVVMNIGNARFVFSPFYLLSAYSFFAVAGRHAEFTLIALLWFFLCVFDPISWVLRKYNQLRIAQSPPETYIGIATQCSAPEIYTIESSYESNVSINIGNIVGIKLSTHLYKIGVISWEQDLLSGRFIEIQCYDFGSTPNRFTCEQLGIEQTQKNVRSKPVASVVLIKPELLSEGIKELIKNNVLHKNICNFIGRVLEGSTIEMIKFSVNNSLLVISEGQIVYTLIHNEIVLYQIINGITAEEILDHTNHTAYLCCYARKLGKYINNQLEIVKWVPCAAEPVFLLNSNTPNVDELRSIANSSIGCLPQTKYQVKINNIDELITHNTAILGILGVGKSCLAFELIQKVVRAGKKVVCIDITNQYCSPKGLGRYVDNENIVLDIRQEQRDALTSTCRSVGSSNLQDRWGNIRNYESILYNTFREFMDSPSSVLILNPDNHNVGKAATLYTIQGTAELTTAEKTRIISEQLLKLCEEQGQSDVARCLLVYEEAHSLIPEWNSVANEGDKAATNGTARVIMQGRKYGLGCFVITQRTANVTKSILNQCNTVFAFRIFDDTGKTFLENYIGSYYSSILPTLEERHTLAIGRGLALKQPVIIQLNDLKYLVYDQDPLLL
ncbi:MAG: DUF87 domain-containing protein [Eubacteriales bacterium]|nr:DUF87 domain-containing protein [Eubacteriales bacterium]